MQWCKKIFTKVDDVGTAAHGKIITNVKLFLPIKEINMPLTTIYLFKELFLQ